MRLKSMIERCIERARRGGCATCDRKDSCVAVKWPEAFAMAGAPAAMAMPPRYPSMPERGAVLAFLGDVAKAFQRNFQPSEKPASPREVPIREAVQEALQPLLPTGEASIDRIASILGVSRQTLYRRLKAEGFTFEQVLDSLRHRLALRYVRDEGISAKEAAYRLGFSDPAAFSRAFKRWTGRSPSDRR